MVPKTPLTLLAHHSDGYDRLSQLGLTFHPRQGTPQGGNEASDGFKAVIDILLRALLMCVDQDNFVILDTDDTFMELIQLHMSTTYCRSRHH